MSINYLAVFMVSLLAGSPVVCFLMRNTIESNIENELENSTSTMLNMVKTSTPSANASRKSRV